MNVRSAELDNTAVPLPFEVYATIRTEQYEKVVGCWGLTPLVGLSVVGFIPI